MPVHERAEDVLELVVRNAKLIRYGRHAPFGMEEGEDILYTGPAATKDRLPE